MTSRSKSTSIKSKSKTSGGKSAVPKKLFTQTIFHDWCKGCGICQAFCPKKVFGRGPQGHPTVDKPDACISCRFCEQHCPDFAISITERTPKRRKEDHDR